MAKFEINKDVFFQRSYILTEATHALTMMALSGHGHCILANYTYCIQLTVYSKSANEAQVNYEHLNELLHDNWQGEIQDFTEDDPQFWITRFTYHF